MALKNRLSLKRIGWLYPIFRDVYFHHGLLAAALAARLLALGNDHPVTPLPKSHFLHSTRLTPPATPRIPPPRLTLELEPLLPRKEIDYDHPGTNKS